MKYKDPNRKREAEKYGRPIPSREFILDILDNAHKPLGFRQLYETLELANEEDQTALKHRLRAMERDGQLLFNRRKQYVPVTKADLVAGRIIGHPDGFGFLVPDEGGDDLYLSSKQMRSVLHGDRALASVIGIDRKGRREGALVEVLEHNTEQVVGRLFIDGGLGFVVPDNKRISQDVVISPENMNDAEEGQIVVAGIIDPPNKRAGPIGKILEVLGEHMGPGMEIDIALRSHELPHEWPTEVTKEIASLTAEVSEADKEGRRDLRKTPLVTIDGEDSRDFDDAVYCERDGKNWRLLVAIADVSHYVETGTALDKEAWNRGTSVYFPAQVIPMLPEILSNGLCSLNPKVDRLCMVCEVSISPKGEILDYDFFEGVMHSAARLTYDHVAKVVVDKDPEARKKCRGYLKHLDNLYGLYKVLRKSRTQRGSIDFETSETRIIYSESRKIEQIVPTERNDAHKLIEECMITANVCSAKFLQKHKIPSLHRAHPYPEAGRLEDVRSFLATMGLTLGGGDKPHPKNYAEILQQIADRPDFHLIQTVLLRSLSQATYKPDSDGHFGLSLDHYAHFTSPIRRYPDLLVHRGIRHVIRGGKAKDFHYSQAEMVELGEHCSMAERRAEDASRDVTAWLKAEFMQDKVGETFEGIISAVTSFGLFVELENIYVEGLVHVTALKSDYYHFDPVKHEMAGERSGKKFRLGDRIQILVARVDIDERKIDFVLPGSENSDDNRPPKKSSGKGGGKKPQGKKKQGQKGKPRAESKKPAKKGGKKPYKGKKK
ncbi:MAG: 3'-to-5' exoribonuclease RNase R [uncultured Thiotrichaceae bacterium]|uniref:Ribonuclease R n=1 Tax=uncultured Thiotrichaceae bacterium TaxID=298394 RepID=A0A6S6TZW2_9GAMM|nr:MAG: 3'-to-5' exoribonuclease RNase R [uncultured Thiotrichaceae bacterium]